MSARRVDHPLQPAWVLAVLVGLVYGLAARFVFDNQRLEWAKTAFAAMSVAFLFLVPLALGALVVTLASASGPRSIAFWIFGPWLTCLLLMLAALALAWEGWICLVMAAPIFLVISSLGGVLAGLIGDARRRARARATAALAVLPFLVAPLESSLLRPEARREVTTGLEIAAPPEVVWAQVVRVPEIGRDERADGFYQRIGIPRPLEATLDRDGPDGVREARFVGGIRFVERIDEWRPPRALGFSVAVDPASVSPDTLDRHVRVGGEYFDVDHGRFTIEPLGPARVRLVLTSEHRLTTRLNAYAGLWTDAVMRDLQLGICRVIRARSEARAGTLPSRAR